MSVAFFGGLVVGATLMAAAFVIYFNMKSPRRPRREVPNWEVDFYEPEPPAVTTRIINRHREFQL